MKKILIAILSISATLYAEEVKYDLGIKNVVGKDEQPYKIEADSDKTVEGKEIFDKKKLKIDEKVVPENKNKPKPAEIKVTKKTFNDRLIYVIANPVETIEKERLVPVYPKREQNGYFMLGTGGYKSIDSFRFDMNYAKSIEDDIRYKIEFNHDISGELQRNSDKSDSRFFGELNYKNLKFSAEERIGNHDYGRANDAIQGIDWNKKDKISILNAGYKINIDKNSDIEVSGGFYYNNSDATTASALRAYDDKAYSGGVAYSRFDNLRDLGFDNLFDIKADYQVENLKRMNVDETQNIYSFFMDNTVKLKKMEGIDIKTSALIEKREDKGNLDFSYSGELKARVTDSFIVNLKAEKDSSWKSNRTLKEGFKYDEDILPSEGLSNQDLLNFSGGVSYNNNLFNIEGLVSKKNGKNMLMYQADTTIVNGQTPIVVKNVNTELDWIEYKVGTGIKLEPFFIDAEYTHRDTKKITYLPEDTIGLKASYAIQSHVFEVSGKYNSEMNVSSDVIGSYGIVDVNYTYIVNTGISVGLGVNNVTNTVYDYKPGYRGETTKVMTELKVVY